MVDKIWYNMEELIGGSEERVLIETYWNVKINEPNTEGGENTDQDEQEQETAETNEPDTDQEGGEDDGEENELHKKKSSEKND